MKKGEKSAKMSQNVRKKKECHKALGCQKKEKIIKKTLVMNVIKALQMNKLVKKKTLNDGMSKRCQKRHNYKSWFLRGSN
jgi:hypothetical protein